MRRKCALSHRTEKKKKREKKGKKKRKKKKEIPNEKKRKRGGGVGNVDTELKEEERSCVSLLCSSLARNFQSEMFFPIVDAQEEEDSSTLTGSPSVIRYIT